MGALHAACGGSEPIDAPPPLGVAQGPLTTVEQAQSLGVSALVAVGDVNGDGHLTAADAAAIAARVADDGAPLACEAAGDIDGDGQIGTEDVSAIDELLAFATPKTTLHPTLRPQPLHQTCDTTVGVAAHHLVTPGGAVPIVLLDADATLDSIEGPATLRTTDGRTSFVVADSSASGDDEIHVNVTVGGVVSALTITVDVIDGMDAGAALATFGGATNDNPDNGQPASDDGATSSSGVGWTTATPEGDGAGGNGGSDIGGAGANVPQPPAVPPPGSSGGVGVGTDCPQRGNGCCALLLDFSPANSPLSRRGDWDRDGNPYGGDKIGPMTAALEQECSVEVWRASTFRVTPKPQRRVVVIQRLFDGSLRRDEREHPEARYQQILTRWQQANAAANAALTATIESHHDCVADEPESAIELTLGHGLPNSASFTATSTDVSSPSCGKWFGNQRVTLDRSTFINDNYCNTKGRVCTWTMFDMSCYSGRSTVALGYANNGHGAVCNTPTTPPQENVAAHAGHDSDLELSSSHWNTRCSFREGDRQVDAFQHHLEEGGATALNLELTPTSFAAHYSDSGYTYPGMSYSP